MKKFFTIGQVVQSCGLSCATILRLEEKGLLKPVQIDVKSGDWGILKIFQKLSLTIDLSIGEHDIMIVYIIKIHKLRPSSRARERR